MPAHHDLTDAEIGELEDLLAAIPEPFEPLDVSMIDGYLCGILAQPVALEPAQWIAGAFDWNAEDGAEPLKPETPGWHAAKHERLLGLIHRRHQALHEAMVNDGWFDPIVMEAEGEDGQPLKGKALIAATLGTWVMGFEHAQNLFPDLTDLADEDLPDLLACLWRHLPAQTEEEQAYTKALDQEHPLKSLDAALEDLVMNVVTIADVGRQQRLKVDTVKRDGPKVGRNDPCPCGSGRKFKQCHGKAEG